MEDILNIFDGRAELVGEIAAAKAELRQYIVRELAALLGHAGFGYAVQAAARGDRGREALIFSRLEVVCDLS